MMLSARFKAVAEEFSDEIRDHWRFCAEEERRILADPLRNAPILVEELAEQKEHFRDLIMARFGLDIADLRRDIENTLPPPVTPVNVVYMVFWEAQYRHARDAYLMTRGYARENEEEAWFVCRVWIEYMRLEPILTLVTTERVREMLEETWEDARYIPRIFSELVAAGVTGMFAGRISLRTNRRLHNALDRERCDLLELLPAEALIVWDERKLGDDLDSLASTTANRLERGLSLLREPKYVADVEDDLAEFERLETLRQQSRQLDALEHRAVLSLRQEQVYRRLRQNMQPEAIAADLGITRNNVYQIKRNVLKKLEAARMSAGL